MPILTLVAALTFQSSTKPQESPLPVQKIPELPQAARDWTGFSYLPVEGRTFPTPFLASQSWPLPIPTSAAPATWRARLVILPRVDQAFDQGSQYAWPNRYGLDSASQLRIRRAIPQLQALVSSLTKGQVDLKVDLVEDAEPLWANGRPWVDQLQEYLSPRINGGKYESEDNVFRGPYHSVFVIHSLGTEPLTSLEVQNTPVTAFGLSGIEGHEVDGGLALKMAQAWVEQIHRRATAAGYDKVRDQVPPRDEVSGLPSPDPYLPEGWSPVLALGEAPLDARLKLLAAPGQAYSASAFAPSLLAKASIGTETKVSVDTDPERGQVLTVTEGGATRNGGMALPRPAGDAPLATVSQTPTLSFWMKSSSKDEVSLNFVGPDGTLKAVTLGSGSPFVYDGAWHPVKIDLRLLQIPALQSIYIGPTAAQRGRPRISLAAPNASFAEFRFTTDSPDTPSPEETPASEALTRLARVKWAATAPPGDERRKLLKDSDEVVRANALRAAATTTDPADEPALTDSALYTYEPMLYRAAMDALYALKTPTAIDTLKRSIRAAVVDGARAYAADLLANDKDATLTALILPLNQGRTRAARILAVRALGKIPGPEAALVRMAFLPQEDPELKLTVTRFSDANDDYQGRKLLWSAVNEPSDSVRLESLRRLSYSSVAEFKAEGLKGIRDDSVGVRIGLLEAWAQEPKPEFAPSIRLALTDRSARVRATAVTALAAVDLESLKTSAVLNDPDPIVQRALVTLVKENKVELSPATREVWQRSPDPVVKGAVTAPFKA